MAECGQADAESSPRPHRGREAVRARSDLGQCADDNARKGLRGVAALSHRPYLGKETVQNILAFRFANALFEPIWDRRYIKNVQITVARKSVGAPRRLL